MTPAAFAPARPGAVLGCGARGQNAAAVAALIDCLAWGLPIHASLAGIRADGGVPGAWLCCQSSGSGGRVKTIRRSHASWIASFEVNRAAFGLSARDRYAVLGQLGHSLALYAALEALHLGAGLMVLAGDSPRRQRATLAEAGATVLYATPTQLHRLLLAGQGVLPAVAHVFCGGGRLDAACRAGVAALCPNAAIRAFYGASETSFITIADAETPEGSVGRAYPGVDLRLDAEGRIAVASPYLFQGYAEPDLPMPPRRDGHLTTGDIGRLDDRGNLFLRGRESRMVTVADRNLFLEDVEAVLAAASARPCAALALPDARRGHAVVAAVEGAGDDALAASLRRACREALGDHAAPRRIVFLARLPRLGSDKPDLAALARLVAP
ncbi:long-chain acyl-CoA synthetase [Paracoccus aminovorans]|uniref:Long-chain acyl-CoA synthetase n=1 Tax=Paracoccus aminovorans TaxID=34004 RepID=A0A1I2Z494_9RHOB|nr:AMP-binding protein [Paracoccus aminovorans]CQR83973.1 AMP-dependent synthetase and ligase [Paracoccus aminovorans]SFH32693.1 long-chain acyl-CoA synthetase [Paracoccus aminovorans]